MQAKQPLSPRDKILQISRQKNAGEFAFLAKIFLKKFDEVELHGLGEATKTVAQVAEYLQRKGYVTITKIETQTFVPEGDRRGGKKVKLISICKITEEGKKKIEEDLSKKDQRGDQKQE